MDGRILLMDSSEFQLNRMRYIIGALGSFEFLEFTSAEQLFASSASMENLSLIIMELSCPSASDGFGVLARIRANTQTRNTPIIITTKHDDLGYRKEALKHTVGDYIVKPYETSRLENSVKSIVTIEKPFKYCTQGINDVSMTFNEYMNLELKIAQRTNTALSVLLISPVCSILPDPDDDREVLGQFRDKIYSFFSSKAQAFLRLTDRVSLNGNGDILVILPATGADGAKIANSKLLKPISEEIAHCSVKYEDLFNSACVTFPQDGTDLPGLMEAACGKILSRAQLDRASAIPPDTREYARKKYQQLRKWTLNF